MLYYRDHAYGEEPITYREPAQILREIREARGFVEASRPALGLLERLRETLEATDPLPALQPLFGELLERAEEIRAAAAAQSEQLGALSEEFREAVLLSRPAARL
ncbi:MAG: hypothetical protein WDA00_07865 [Eubacteriales bacterium]